MATSVTASYCSGSEHHLSELRIVLVGSAESGKSSAGNTILNREEFELKRTAQCVKRQREVAERHITVVEAPGWRKTKFWLYEPRPLKQEMVIGVSLCPPGPHAVLLVINLSKNFQNKDMNELLKNLELLTYRVWSHTIVLFTCGDYLGDTPIEQHIESEGKDLQWLVEKCGNRYHVLNNMNRSDDSQVTELLEKIEEMVAANSGCHFEMDRKILQEVEEKRQEYKHRGELRLLKVKEQRKALRSKIGDTQHLSDLRIVLLGCRNSGKSSAGNTILNREEFELKTTAQCVKRQREVAERHITVVEAPGWWSGKNCVLTLEHTKQEILLSISKCHPGPHSILLVIDLTASFRDEWQKVLYEHVQFLTERVWSHAIVLFTCGDCLGDTPIEQHIESEGKDLQWLVEKCGNRYHVLNNMNRSDDSQVTELLEKIEEMVAANSGRHFEMDRKILQEVEEKRREEEERGKERMMKVQKQRESIRSQMGEIHHLSELRIVLLGCMESGKTSAGNTILNREEFELKRTAQCVKRQREVAERHITVVEAPGWWIYYPVEESTELLKQEIVLSVSLCPPGPHCILLVLPVGLSLSTMHSEVFQGLQKLLGMTYWSHTIVLFTWGDYLGDTPIEQHIESEGKDLQWLVEKCGSRYHVLNNMNRSDDSQVTELLEKIEEMVAANSGCHFEMDRKILQEMKEKRRAEEERVKERMMKVQKQRELRSHMCDSHRLSDLKIVLLGYRDAGKSSAGNTILNRKEFELKRTAQCVKRQREVAERHITVVEAPGWWNNIPVEENTELLKQEIVLSVSLCPPGPHAVLLVIDVVTVFNENYRNIVEGYLKLLPDTVLSHTIVLFTFGDCLGDTPIEQHIESEGKDLQWLVEKCGNRYHVLNNKNRSDDSQVTELLEKIEEMVAANSGRHFEMDRKILQEVEEKRRAEEERVKERMMKVQKQREEFRSHMCDSHRLSDLRIVLLGYRGAGKSSAGNTILNRKEFELKRTAQCVKRQREVAERHITVVEAPGWWRGEPVEESTELLKQEIVLSVSLCLPGPHAVLLIIDVVTVFNENYRNIVEGYLKLLTDTVWSHTIILFTRGDYLRDTPIEQHIESEGKDLQWLVEKCGNRYHVLNNKNRSDDTQVTELLEKIEEMVAANNGRHFEMDSKILQEVEEKRRAEDKRAKERMMKVQKRREELRSQMYDPHHLSDLRIVLLGYRYSGKSSAGNTILNREEFELKTTAQCVKRQREVAERHITVVEAPGWWRDVPVEENTELLKQEIVLSVSLCPPGPHAVLLVIDVDSYFKENHRNTLEGYLNLLPDTVWSHTIVLFTCGDCLGDTPIEQHIESEGKDLQWLVEKCGNRYHVLNNMNRSDDTQVTELLEKIEEMVTANSGRCFKMDRKILQEVEEKRRAEDKRAKERMMKVQKRREELRSQMCDSHCLSDLRIVLLGYRYSGKSSAGNTILNREEFELKRTAQCVKRQREVAERHITVVEAPGWWSNIPVEWSTELLKQEIVLSVSLCPPGPHAVLLIIRVDSVFKENERNILEEYLNLLPDTVWSYTIVLFTCGDYLGDTPIEQHIESEGKDLQWLVEKCGNKYHVLNNMNRSDDSQVTELLEKIEEMVAANSGRHFEMDRKILQEVEEKRRAEEERVKERMMKVQKQREQRGSHMCDLHHLSDLRIVLLGYIGAGKSSAGNTILNREDFELKRTAHCVKRQREVAERHITVVEAPGWWRDVPVERSTELLKQEIVLSVSLCPPGPHAVLLIIRVDSVFNENHRNILEGYLNLLPDTVWSHTIVLFTCGDCLGDTPIEQHIESERKDLQWLVEKCGNRYHVLNNKNRSDDTQVTELLEKIEEMVTANSGRHFEMDRKILQEVEEKRRAEERVKEMMRKLQIQKEYSRLQMLTEDERSDTWSLASSGYVSMSDNSSVYGFSRTNSCESLTHDPKYMQHLKNRLFFEHKTRSANTRDSDVENTPTENTLYGDSASSCDLVVEDSSSVSAQHPYTEHLSTATEGFLPEIISSSSEAKNINLYRFQCPHAGQFRCRLTNLIFEMKSKGEVIYRIDTWDIRLLDGLGQMEPAGPLYNIDCFEGSISHLHLPHCEIQYEANQAGLAVAHFTGENIEVIPPVKVTNSHVIISIQDLSLFGLLKKMILSNTINAQILLFYKEMIGKKSWKQLHIHLLPVNVPVEEVGKKHKGATYFETSSTCELTTGKKYKPSCDPHVSQPKVAKFVRDYGPNYHPTFVVFFEAEKIAVSILDQDDVEVWEPRWIFLTSEKTDHSAETSPLKMDTGAEFVDKNREKLIQRVPSVMEITDCLKCKSMITDEMYCSVQAAKTSQEQMRILYRALDSGGTAVKEEFYDILQKKQRFLVDDLRAGPSKA